MSVYIKKVGYEEAAIYEFACDNCHCEWAADANETTCRGNQWDWRSYDEVDHVMACPCCGRTVSAHTRSCRPIDMVLRPRDGGYLFVDEFGRITNGENC